VALYRRTRSDLGCRRSGSRSAAEPELVESAHPPLMLLPMGWRKCEAGSLRLWRSDEGAYGSLPDAFSSSLKLVRVLHVHPPRLWTVAESFLQRFSGTRLLQAARSCPDCSNNLYPFLCRLDGVSIQALASGRLKRCKSARPGL